MAASPMTLQYAMQLLTALLAEVDAAAPDPIPRVMTDDEEEAIIFLCQHQMLHSLTGNEPKN